MRVCIGAGRLNNALRMHEEDTALLLPFMPYMRLLLSGLYKLPLVQAKMYRGVGAELAEVHK